MFLWKCGLQISAVILMGQALSGAPDIVRDHLAASVEGTRELVKNGRESGLGNQVAPRLFDDNPNASSRCFPTAADVKRYADLRPWFWQYMQFLSHERPLSARANQSWSRPEDAPALRQLLSDPDPAIRGLAVEALATFHDPEDIPGIASLLHDTADSVPALGWNTIMSAGSIWESPDRKRADRADLTRSWQSRRVCGYARAALTLMTGQDLDAPKFEKWWESNHGGPDRIWFWQERLHRDLTSAEASVLLPRFSPNQSEKDFQAEQKRWHEDLESKLESARGAVGRELEKLPVEVELKVRLLAVNRYSTILGSDLDEPLMGDFICARASSGRLLELLERKNLWDDVTWNEETYNILVSQLAGQADKLFTRADVDRLRAVQSQEHHLWWKAQAALFVGISRLLPSAPSGRQDLPDTQDGTLREGVRTLGGRSIGDVAARGAVASELVKIGLPRNGDFLVDQFFSEPLRPGETDMRTNILRALGSPPTTAVKREFLLRLLLDKRFEPLWIEPRGTMGADQHRTAALAAVGAYTGTYTLGALQDHLLADPAHAAQALSEVQKTVRETLAAPQKPDAR